MELTFWLIDKGVRASSKKERQFEGSIVQDILHYWEACIDCSCSKVGIREVWIPPSEDLLKSNVDGAARGKPAQQVLLVCFVIVKGKCYLCFLVVWVSRNPTKLKLWQS